MSNNTSKNEIKAYGREVEKLWMMNRSFSPFLMCLSRINSALIRHPELVESLGEDDPEQLALLQEHFYQLMIIWDRYRPDRELDDSELNHARKILSKMCPLTDEQRQKLQNR